MPNKKFEGGELGEGQGDGKFQTAIEATRDKQIDRTLEAEELLGVSEEVAREIFGERFYGPDEAASVFGTRAIDVPDIPFTRAELERANAQGAELIFQVDSITLRSQSFRPEVYTLTLEQLIACFPNRRSGALAWSDRSASGTWATLREESVFNRDTPRYGWRLVFPNIEPPQDGADFPAQALAAVAMLKRDILAGSVPPEYKSAIQEFEAVEALYRRTKNTGLEREQIEALHDVLKLPLFSMLLERPVEVAYRIILADHLDRSIDSRSVWARAFWPNQRSDETPVLAVVGTEQQQISMRFFKISNNTKDRGMSLSLGAFKERHA